MPELDVGIEGYVPPGVGLLVAHQKLENWKKFQGGKRLSTAHN